MNDRFELPAELTIYSALETRDALLAWAKQQNAKGQSPLKVSAGSVGAVDGAGMQLLAALGNMHMPWVLVDSSEVFSDACRLLGLLNWLDSPYIQTTELGV